MKRNKGFMDGQAIGLFIWIMIKENGGVLCCQVLGFILISVLYPNLWNTGDPNGIIQKAIQAHGGENALSKFSYYYYRASGNNIFPQKDKKITIQTWIKSPNYIKIQFDTFRGADKNSKLTLYDSKKGFRLMNGEESELSKKEIKNLILSIFQYSDIKTLTPLLKKKFKLTKIEPEIGLNGQVLIGITAETEDLPKLYIYFDRSSYLLSAIKTIENGDNSDIEISKVYFTKYVYINNIPYPTYITTTVNGKELISLPIIDYRFLRDGEDQIFRLPKK